MFLFIASTVLRIQYAYTYVYAFARAKSIEKPIRPVRVVYCTVKKEKKCATQSAPSSSMSILL